VGVVRDPSAQPEKVCGNCHDKIVKEERYNPWASFTPHPPQHAPTWKQSPRTTSAQPLPISSMRGI